MKPVWRILPFLISDGQTNMSLDEAILQARIKGLVPNTIRFYRWNPSCASIGRNQSLKVEIDMQAAEAHKVDVVRRISGGGAVFHDNQSEITYAVIATEEDLRTIYKTLFPNSFFGVSESYTVITHALIHGLQYMGFHIDSGKIHCPALFMEDKKISGNAQARQNGVILQHGTLLLHVNPEFMYTILKAPEGVAKGKMVRSVKAKVKGLYDDNNTPSISDTEFQTYMIQGFENTFHVSCEFGDITPNEQELMQIVKKNRYSDNHWLYKIP
ncbi:MAG: lipoate--protein ligase family protein [Candidatus Lokiarchaeota archaeon]|nr:lipoate--protein ligase family protein [Candidatus Lokiarchaeota archaeon]